MTSADQFLAAYDRQLRTDAEAQGALAVERLGPLLLCTFAGGRGFVTYRNLDGAGCRAIDQWVVEALAYFRGDPAVVRVEWKTRGHDYAPGLHDALLGGGFEPEEEGSIVSAGRLEPVPGADFAGIWGGATREEWRGQGIYRAVTAARAQSAVKLGKKLIHSDSTGYSRPILERHGFLRVSTTTPYCWRR